MDGAYIETDFKAWDVRHHQTLTEVTYFFELRDAFKFKQGVHMTVIVRMYGHDPFTVINQSDAPSNPALRREAMVEFFKFYEFILEHQLNFCMELEP
jgi:hypothetical protein